jgi:L-malate glycosyltransferase
MSCTADTARFAAVGSRTDTAVPTCLHVFPSFEVGGVALRMARIINHLGAQFRHTIIALNGNFEAAPQLGRNVDVDLFRPDRARQGTFGGILAAAGTLRRLQPQLLLTYNWGAIEWAIANRLLPVARHIHLESGFGKEEADAQLRRRVLCRRWALASCHTVVVPSRRLEELARSVWKLPTGLVRYLPNGVDLGRFASPVRGEFSHFARRQGELIVGTVAPLRPEKNVGRLLRAFARLGEEVPARLVIAGDGPERNPLVELAAEMGISERIVFLGQTVPEKILDAFDVFALSSDTEQMPNALLEAMAAGRAVAAVDVGDVKSMVCEENRLFVAPRDDPAAFTQAIDALLRDAETRARLGRGNLARARAEYSQERMFAGYAEIFAMAEETAAAAACGNAGDR